MKKRGLAILLTLCLLLGMIPAGVMAADVEAGGTCGENLTWTLDSDGVLTISGTGEMDIGEIVVVVPWSDYRTSITSVVIEAGVTTISRFAFSGCSSLTSVTIPDSVTFISDDAFGGCDNLTIYGNSGSYAETYAEENDIPFVALNPCENGHTWDDGKVTREPTYTAEGGKDLHLYRLRRDKNRDPAGEVLHRCDLHHIYRVVL